MHTEYEVRVLEVNKEEIIKKLELLNAKKVGDWNQKRYVYDLKPANPGKWIRLRTNGIKTTLTYQKAICETMAERQRKQLEQEKAQKAKKAKGTEKEITNLLTFKKRQAYA